MTQMSADDTDGSCGAGESVCRESGWECGLVAVLPLQGTVTGRAADVGAVGCYLGDGSDHEGTSLLEEHMFYISMR
jgi:hypothetical protein